MQLIKSLTPTPPEIKLSSSQIEAINARKISDTDILAGKLETKNEAQVMLITSINLKDRLLNGFVGRVMGFKFTDSTVKNTYVKFNDKKAGKMAMKRDNIESQNCWLPIEKVETSFSLRNNRCIQVLKEFSSNSFNLWRAQV